MKDELIGNEVTVTKDFEDTAKLHVGDTVTVSTVITEEDVLEYAKLTTDTNEVHTDDAFASDSIFDGKIVHGTFLLGFLSSATARLPGTIIYRAFQTDFLEPVHINQRITATAEVIEHQDGDAYLVKLRLTREDGATCISGSAKVLVGPF